MLRPFALLTALFTSSPAWAHDRCPVELTEAAAQLESARGAHQEARAALFDDNWKARLSMANDRDAEMALHQQAKDAVGDTRRARRAARRALREMRASHKDAPSTCVSAARSPWPLPPRRA